MVKLNTEKQGKDYLVDLYDTLYKDLRFDTEFFAIANVVSKMYSYDKEKATSWSFQLINRYGVKALRDSVNDFDYEGAIRDFIDDLIHDLIDNYDIGNVIKLIHDRVRLYEVKFFLWSYLFSPNRETNKMIIYFDELIKSKKYDEAKKMMQLVIDNQGYIPIEIFDATLFLNNIIATYTSMGHKIKDQQLLDLLYSFVDLVPEKFNKAVLKSNFVDYI